MMAGITHRLWDILSDKEVSNLKSLVRPPRRLRILMIARTESDADCVHWKDLQTTVHTNRVIAANALANLCKGQAMQDDPKWDYAWD
jgi:hypothetical protein